MLLRSRLFLALLMFVFLYAQSFFFGQNDYITLGLIVISAALMYQVVSSLQYSSKLALRINAKPEGFLYRLLSRDKTLLMRLFSVIGALFFASLLVLVLKSLTLNYGVIPFFVLVMSVSVVMFTFLNAHNASIKLGVLEDNLATDLARHASSFMYVIVVAMVLNVILSLIFSVHDTHTFLYSNVSLDNFDAVASSKGIEKLDYNSVSRVLINFFILVDTFKIAVADLFLELFVGHENKLAYYYLFYVVVFIFNMLKLFAFSLAFVLLQKGLESVALFSVKKTLFKKE